MQNTNSGGYAGAQDVDDGSTEFNALSFLVNQILNARNVATLVQIKAVTNSGGLSPVGFVDVQPMVNQLDGDRNAVPHGVVYHLPYFRLQGGTDAIILDPKVGDIGLAVFADHDISSVKASKKASNPGSMRRSAKQDGLYFGGFLNGVPMQYVRFSAAGIELVSPTKIKMTAPDVEVVASNSFTVTSPTTTLTGDLIANGTALIKKLLTYLAGLAGTGTTGAPSSISGPLKSNGVNVGSDHAHGGITRGTQLSDGPQ